jgi:hypothetical protein
MRTSKNIILCILFLTAIPCELIIAQQASADSTAINELEDKYDSVITKAALALTGAQYNEASGYYKEASLLKPMETYPLKMIRYVQNIMTETAEKQKLADELKRRAQVKDYLNKANNAILAARWDSARILFSEILTLHPEKTDADYAKSKIEAIDLELKRIVLRTPPKQEPIVIAPPKNRSEARARRKLAERNAIIAAASAKQAPQTQAPLQPKNGAVTPAARETFQKPTAAPLPQRPAAANAPVKQVPAIPAPSRLPVKNVAVAAPAAREVTQKPIQTTPPVTNVAIAAQPTKEAYQKPVQTTASAPGVTVTAPAVQETLQKPIQTTPLTADAAAATQATKEAYRPPVQTTAPAKSVTIAAPAVKEIPQKPIQITSPNTNPAASASTNTEVPQRSTETQSPVIHVPVAVPPTTKAAPQKATEMPLPSAKIPAAAPAVNEVPQQSTETSSPERNGAAPLTKEVSTDASSLKLSDSSNYIKLICKDISFIGTNAYVKVLIQNYSSTESFTADTLQVSIRKNNGTVKKLDQRFISSFPVVTPLQETILVAFTDASAGVEPDDVFILEMRNRKDKTTLALQIPWALYQQQKNL